MGGLLWVRHFACIVSIPLPWIFITWPSSFLSPLNNNDLSLQEVYYGPSTLHT